MRTEIATGGDPAGALVKAIAETTPTDGGVYRVGVQHDEGCPCVTRQQPISSCTCEIISLKRKRLR
jgi:hypothetical protein